MSEHHLEIAREFIRERDIDSARKVLNKIPDNPTARNWLARLDEFESKQREAQRKPRPVELPPQLEVIIRKHLTKDEIVLWHQQPEPVTYTRYVCPKWTIALFLTMGFGLLALFFLLNFVFTNRGVTSFFLLQVFTPIVFLVTPSIWLNTAQRRAEATHYVLTNRQAYIVEKLKVRRVFPTRIEVVTESTGFESVIFHRHTGIDGFFKVDNPVGFLGISGAAAVKQIVAATTRVTIYK